MTKIAIINNEGKKIIVKTTGNILGIKVGDIITSTRIGSFWRNKDVVVEGFEAERSKLWGKIIGKKKCLYAEGSDLLYLKVLKKKKSSRKELYKSLKKGMIVRLKGGGVIKIENVLKKTNQIRYSDLDDNRIGRLSFRAITRILRKPQDVFYAAREYHSGVIAKVL